MDEPVYVTFGQTHIHKVNGHVLDKDSVAKVHSRDLAHELFGVQFFATYTWDEIEDNMCFYPRGIIDLTN